MLRAQRVDLVLDVGANAGQYAQALRGAGYDGRIISFEPLEEAHARCRGVAAADPCWDLASPMALGAEEGTSEIHVANNSVSSSLRPMLETHVQACPESSVVARQTVHVRRLDHVLPGMLEEEARLFLKIDTQGTEDEVLLGSEGVLEAIVGIQVEMSLNPLYAGAPSFGEVLGTVLERGFVPWGFLPGFTDRKSGRMLQVDGVFFRP